LVGVGELNKRYDIKHNLVTGDSIDYWTDHIKNGGEEPSNWEKYQEQINDNSEENIFNRFKENDKERNIIMNEDLREEFHNKLDKDFIFDFWNSKTVEEKASVILMKFPLYYGKSNIWYSYITNESKWILCDEHDIVASIKLFFEPNGYSKPQKRAELLNALKDQSRINKPEDLDEKWLHFGEKLYNIKTKENINMHSEKFSLIKIPHNIGKSTDTPIIDKKIISWVGEDQYKLFVQMCAYSMLKAYPFARFFIFYGTGQDGKSTAGNFIMNLIGSENSCDIDIDQLNTNRFESQKLYQKTLAICGEVDYKILKNTRKLKGITGNDSMTIEFKNKNPFMYKNFAKLLWYANGIPPTYDKTQGFYRRTIIIKFPNKFNECVDPLGDITEIEYENFCLKCTEYLQDLLLNGFDEKTIEDKTKEYEDLSDPVLKFIDSMTVAGEDDDFITMSDAFKEYGAFAKKYGYRTFNYQDFTSMCKNVEEISVELKKVYISNENDIYLGGLNKPIDVIRRTNKSLIMHRNLTGLVSLGGLDIPLTSATIATNSNIKSNKATKASSLPIKPSSLNPLIKTFISDNDKGEGVHFDEICKTFDKNEAKKSLAYMYAYGGVVTIGKDKYKLGEK